MTDNAETAELSAEETIEPNEAAPEVRLPELIPLDRLCRSALNVRTTEFDADIPSLAEAIAANGLKQNLVVVPGHYSTAIVDDPDTADWSALFEVNAGGRRFQALKLLAQAGRLPADHPVACLVEERDTARETSLDENLHKVTMNPADEFIAFDAIVAQHEQQGADREAAIRLCARRFGKTPRHVRERMRLADLAPEILQALREDKLTVEAAKAYAAVSDHALQLKVFKAQAKAWNGQEPRSIREALRGKTLPASSPQVTWVGLDAYLAAGGRTEVEMFMGTGGEERVLDVALLEKLAAEKAEPLLAARAKKDGYAQGVFAQGAGYYARTPKAPKGFVAVQHYYDSATKAQKKKSIAIYSIDGSGQQLELRTGRFKPADEKEPERQVYTPPSPEELAAQRKEEAIERLQSRLAVGKFAGSPFEGRAFWPQKRWIDPIEEINDDEVLVAVLVKVTKADIAAQREAAEAKYAEEEAAAEAEKLKQAQAFADEHGADVGEVLDDMEEDDNEDEQAA